MTSWRGARAPVLVRVLTRVLSHVLAALAVVLGVAAMAGSAQAQRPVVRTPARSEATPRSRADSIKQVQLEALARVRADSIARTLAGGDTLRARVIADSLFTLAMRTAGDTLRERESIGRGGLDSAKARLMAEWDAPDSVMSDLLTRRGFSVTRYQGKNVIFKALEHTMNLVGKRAAVQRDSATLVGDTIQFNDSTNIVIARGDTLLLRDPSQGQDDILALGSIRYDVNNRRGVVRDVTTSVESGQRWIVQGNVAAFKGDSSDTGQSAFYARDGWLTSCEELEPHYHFAARELKLVSKNVMVARPAILYIADVPVMWLPFVFQDMRPGRRSGILAPRLGFNQIFRQSPFMRRTIEDIGYYFALNDYVDAQVSMDWRSDARSTAFDPGYLKFTGQMQYKWRDRFISGTLASSYHYLRNGQTNIQYSLNHQQEFSQRTRLNATFNYVTNTTIQRNISFNPQQSLQTIRSSLNYTTGRGPVTVNIGGTQTQYPGRSQLDRDFPSLGITTKPIRVGENFTWSPGLNITNSQSFDIDQVGDFAYRYRRDSLTGVLDSTKVRRNTRRSTISFETPVQIYGFNWRNSIRISDQLNDFPQRRTIYTNVNDTTSRVERVFARDYVTGLDWDTGFNLPSFFQGSWNLTPSVSFQKVDGRSPLVVRTERTGGKFLTQSMRPSYGVSLGPKLYRFFPGFGPVAAIRHSIEPTMQFAYTPKGNVSNEFLAAMGDIAQGYLGNNEQNTISLGLSTVFEAKLRGRDTDGDSASARLAGGDSAGAPGLPGAVGGQGFPSGTGGFGGAASSGGVGPDNERKIKLLSLTFTTLSYDFVRARKSTGGTGLNNRNFDYTARSDLLPGFDFGVSYSLFQGDPVSDTARFKPYREGMRGTLSLDGNSPLVRGMARMLGIRMMDEAERRSRETRQGQGPGGMQQQRGSGGMGGGLVANRPIQGSVNQAALQIPSGQGWRVNLSYSASRQRPPTGSNVQSLDPTIVCEQFRLSNPLGYDACVRQQQTSGSVSNPYESTTRGSTYFVSPPQSSVQGNMSFHITEKWGAQWQTTYDVQRNEFASHVVSLQRELHDWDAIFAFSRSPNGNFSFNFFIALKAQPDIKFNYDRPQFPRGYTGNRSIQ
ncbi:MAG: LPS-assembly protein LptD [Gemmatimonadetes bacterium]|nr:LPS-assembly protein LptD [Gemmatimonadota bacterium]